MLILTRAAGRDHKPRSLNREEEEKQVEPKMKPPTCDVYVNLTGSKMPAGTPVPKIASCFNTEADGLGFSNLVILGSEAQRITSLIPEVSLRSLRF